MKKINLENIKKITPGVLGIAVSAIYIFGLKTVNLIGDHINPSNYFRATFGIEERERTFTIFEYYILGRNFEGKIPKKPATEKIREII